MEDPMAAPSLTASPTTVLTEICTPQLQISQSDHHAATNTTRISDSANCDNEELTVSIRLGGILPSDDEEEDVTNAQSSSAGPASPLRTAETERINTPVAGSTIDASLRSQIDTLQQIASMESREYQQRLMENSIDTTTIQDRSLMQICQSLHRSHSIILNLNEENDSQTQEILRLQAQDMESQNKIARMEEALAKLVAQKQKLRNKNRAEKSVNRRLVEHLHTVSNAQQQEEDTIGRLLQHEQNLRERCDSNFSSDFEGFDTESVYSMASNRSMVTSEPPTVRIHRERNLTWPHSDFGDDDEVEESLYVQDSTTTANGKGAANQIKDDSRRTRSSTTSPVKMTKPTNHYGSNSSNNNEPSRKVIEGGKSVSTADIWKASMRPSSNSPANFWNNNTSSIGSKDHDPLHKVDRSKILDLGEHDDVVDVRKKKDYEKRQQSVKREQQNKKSDVLEPAFVHDFKVMFGKSSSSSSHEKRKSSGEKFDLFDMFKKDGHETSSTAALNNKMDSSARKLFEKDHDHDSSRRKSQSKPSTKRESKTTVALDNAKHEAKEAADKFKSSMKNMGKMFTFSTDK
ncbi:unnamed protein product [Cylindrotheca closterium]|uniref:Uncharacterized protein n=1 Tax=Cylindrotheca closterium TaxID=2856 RepID=A0AAD2CRG8_9STRA|nr:unnamed protein product [Cylindrotheca closterium]